MLTILVEWLARFVLLILLFLSWWSVKIIIERWRFYRQLIADANTVQSKLQADRRLDKNFQGPGMYGQLIQELNRHQGQERIEASYSGFILSQRASLEKGLPILGTLGSTTPFVGLLGTILGIIVSFSKLSEGAGNTNQVMFSLAEALLLTAMGLFVAIPAVISFNYFSRQLKFVLAQAQAVKDFYIANKE